MPSLLPLLLLGAQTPGDLAGDYVLTVDGIEAPYAAVSARVRIVEGRLACGFGGAFDWPRGWAGFVRDLEVSAADGRPLAVDTTGQADTFAWRLADAADGAQPFAGDVELRYRVDLGYAHRAWDFGSEQAGIVLDGALYTVTKGLFLGSDAEGERRVTFDVPESWRIAVPWTHIEGRTYRMPDLLALQNNTLLLGDFERLDFTREGFALTLALPGPIAEAGGADQSGPGQGPARLPPSVPGHGRGPLPDDRLPREPGGRRGVLERSHVHDRLDGLAGDLAPLGELPRARALPLLERPAHPRRAARGAPVALGGLHRVLRQSGLRQRRGHRRGGLREEDRAAPRELPLLHDG